MVVRDPAQPYFTMILSTGVKRLAECSHLNCTTPQDVCRSIRVLGVLLSVPDQRHSSFVSTADRFSSCCTDVRGGLGEKNIQSTEWLKMAAVAEEAMFVVRPYGLLGSQLGEADEPIGSRAALLATTLRAKHKWAGRVQY
jgi:hypothetical protein